jgi:hypothetical protein
MRQVRSLAPVGRYAASRLRVDVQPGRNKENMMAITSLLDDLPASLIGLQLDAGTSGVGAGVDLLGTDLVDVSIGLGAVDTVLGLVDSGVGSGTGLLDTGTGLLDSLL